MEKFLTLGTAAAVVVIKTKKKGLHLNEGDVNLRKRR